MLCGIGCKTAAVMANCSGEYKTAAVMAKCSGEYKTAAVCLRVGYQTVCPDNESTIWIH